MTQSTDLPHPSHTVLSEFYTLMENSQSIVALTGAGISTESGIPDYRSPDGLWAHMQPITYDEFLASEDARLEDWRRRFIMNDDFTKAVPNAGHLGLVTLASKGQLTGVITQNIDGLHQRSGLRDDQLIELHGNATYGACLDCQGTMTLDEVRRFVDDKGSAPRCMTCGGWVKVAVISFGQSLDRQKLADAVHWTTSCDAFLVVGSSLMVEPAASLPLMAKRAGARLFIVNDTPTLLDHHADCLVRARIGDVFQNFSV